MRNWNWQFIADNYLQSEFRAYLWGIETNQVSSLWKRLQEVPSLPMRNWNLSISSNSSTYLLSSEPTYEELKRIYPPSCIINPPSVPSLPMRNWNPSILEKGYSSVYSSEPTYEELKLYRKPKISQPQGKFRAYLWGIETR